MMSLKTTEEEEEKEEEEEEEATQMQVQQALFEKYSIFLVTHSRGFQPHEKMNQNWWQSIFWANGRCPLKTILKTCFIVDSVTESMSDFQVDLSSEHNFNCLSICTSAS